MFLNQRPFGTQRESKTDQLAALLRRRMSVEADGRGFILEDFFGIGFFFSVINVRK